MRIRPSFSSWAVANVVVRADSTANTEYFMVVDVLYFVIKYQVKELWRPSDLACHFFMTIVLALCA